ncbi:MAG: glycosyl hydrolase family 5 [Planctomycetota bacterium]|jgi:hypothetical protein
MKRPGILTPIVSVLLATPLAAQWEVCPTGDAAVTISREQAPVVRSHYVFWAENWKWTECRLRLDGFDNSKTTFAGAIPGLDLEVGGTLRSLAANRLEIAWNLEANRSLEGVVGGGLEFNLELDSPALGDDVAEPELLPDNRGWRWQADRRGPIVVEFDRPVANVYFERGQKHQIRAMFVGADVPAGKHALTMTVTLPEGGRVAKSLPERYGPADASDWYAGALVHDKSPVDLSFLNHKPAGKHGFVRPEGDRLVFADGTEARFWGGNIAAYAIFEEKERIRAQARRIAQLGFNLMRIHHHDSMGWVSRPVIDKSQSGSQHLDDEVMERLDWWIQCLRDEGVYVWLDLHVGRLFKEGDQIGEGFAEMPRRSRNRQAGAEAKGYCYFNPAIEDLMKGFNEKYLNHVNRYTGTAYKDDPAIMGLLVTNENDLTCHFGNLMLPDKDNPYHNRRFEAAVKAFAERKGLPPGETSRTWEPGPSKLFLSDWERGWNDRVLAHLDGLGVQVPVATTQMWGNMNMCGLPPLMAGGIIDVHSYGSAEALSANPRFESNYVAYMATGQAYGKPVAITEWNVPYPAVDRFTAPLYVASVSALQGWDAPMIYNYSQRAFARPDRQGTWSTFSDPALSGLMPAAALLFRQQHVAPAEKSYCIMLDRGTLYYRGSHPRNMASLRTLVEHGKVTIGLSDEKELDWDAATTVGPDVEVVDDVNRDFIPAGQDFVRSDRGQLTRHWTRGVQVIDTDRTQAVHGWVGGSRWELEDVTFELATPKAAVAVSSLDGASIARSRRLLITAVARVVASEGGRMPLRSEPVRGEVTIRAPDGLRLIPLDGDGSRLEPVATAYADGRYAVALPAKRGTHWLLLTGRR